MRRPAFVDGVAAMACRWGTLARLETAARGELATRSGFGQDIHESAYAIDASTASTRRLTQAYIDKITEIRSDAEFVLLVEKDAAYNRLAEDRFYNQFPCILITGNWPTIA